MSIPGWEAFVGLIAAFGTRDAAPPATITVRQVHGRAVAVCDRLSPGEHADVHADALVATEPGVLVAVKTADCVPVLLTSPRRAERWTAAVHAGWRGAAHGVIEAAVRDAASRGLDPTTLHAAVGPSIGPCCYEVGEDVASNFRRLDLPVVAGRAKPHLDLASIARELLARAGLGRANIVVCAPCTRCHPERYHSYRVAGPGAGRQLSWIGWRA
jgi:YfiH family protein